MKKILAVLLFLIVLFISLITINTLRYTSKQITVDPAPEISINDTEAVERLSQAIQFKTISYQEPERFDRDEFFGLHTFLEEEFPRIREELSKELIQGYSLLYQWEGTDDDLDPLLLLGHLDVVPIEPGTLEDWTYSPFSGKIADGYIWGRGTMDVKLSITGIMEAVEYLLGEGFKPRRTVYLAFGHDEEVGGLNGAKKISILLENRGVELDYILDEGGVIIKGETLGLSTPVALIGIAEKGYVSLELSVQAKGGHSSMPPEHTSVGILSTAIHELERNQPPARIEGATEKQFSYLGPEYPLLKKMIFANRWLFDPYLKMLFASSPATNAMVRTTTAATMFSGSVKENILPQYASAVVNFRIIPGETIEDVIVHVRETIDNPAIDIKPLRFQTEPSKISDIGSETFENMHRTIKQVYPDVIAAPFLFLGATDSRHYGDLSNNIFRFIPFRIQVEDLRRIHGTNERVAIKDYTDYIKFLVQLIRNSQ